MTTERIVNGLSCGEVLERLGDYIDGELKAEDREAVEGHLRGCRVCERFGGRIGSVVKDLREALHESEPLSEPLMKQLSVRLDGTDG